MNDNETNLLTKESTEEIKAEHPYEVEKKTEEQTEISDEYGNMLRTEIPAFEKEKGNEKYNAGMISEASKHYSKALLGMQFLIKDNVIQDQEVMLKLIKDIEIPCNLNLAQCFIKMKEFKSAILHTSKVLEIENDNIKALYRRAISYKFLQEFDCARDDLKKALEIDPHNQEVLAALTQLKKDKLKFNEKLKQISQKMINSLDYADTREEKKAEGYKSKISSLINKLGDAPKIIFSSIKYHCKMIYLIPVGFISERCCKKRMPASFFKKNQ